MYLALNDTHINVSYQVIRQLCVRRPIRRWFIIVSSFLLSLDAILFLFNSILSLVFSIVFSSAVKSNLFTFIGPFSFRYHYSPVFIFSDKKHYLTEIVYFPLKYLNNLIKITGINLCGNHLNCYSDQCCTVVHCIFKKE